MLLGKYEGFKKKREAMQYASDRDEGIYNELTREVQRFPLLAAYDLCLKCSHLFNILDARGAISVTERVGVIARVRALAVGIAKAWVDQQNDEQQKRGSGPGDETREAEPVRDKKEKKTKEKLSPVG